MIIVMKIDSGTNSQNGEDPEKTSANNMVKLANKSATIIFITSTKQ